MGRDLTPSFAQNCPNPPKPLPVGKSATTALCHVCYLCWFHCTRAPRRCPRLPQKCSAQHGVYTTESRHRKDQNPHWHQFSTKGARAAPKGGTGWGSLPQVCRRGEHLPKSAPQRTQRLSGIQAFHAQHPPGKAEWSKKKKCC